MSIGAGAKREALCLGEAQKILRCGIIGTQQGWVCGNGAHLQNVFQKSQAPQPVRQIIGRQGNLRVGTRGAWEGSRGE